MARAFLHSDLERPARADATAAMIALLDDPSVEVRRALAEAVAGACDAPRHLVVALANDEPKVAAPVLARSPLLTDAELVDCAATGDCVVQCAIARRPGLSAGPAAALAEVGGREAARALLANATARLTPGTLRRLFARFGHDAEIREALLARPGLPASLKVDLVLATAHALAQFVGSVGWLGAKRAERIAREARDAALVSVAADCELKERAEFMRTLRQRGALTMALLLRSLLEGERGLASAAFAELSGQSLDRAQPSSEIRTGRVSRRSPARAVCRVTLCPPSAQRSAPSTSTARARAVDLKPWLVRVTIAACEAERDPALAPDPVASVAVRCRGGAV